jgi:hypothetical protein
VREELYSLVSSFVGMLRFLSALAGIFVVGSLVLGQGLGRSLLFGAVLWAGFIALTPVWWMRYDREGDGDARRTAAVAVAAIAWPVAVYFAVVGLLTLFGLEDVKAR